LVLRLWRETGKTGKVAMTEGLYDKRHLQPVEDASNQEAVGPPATVRNCVAFHLILLAISRVVLAIGVVIYGQRMIEAACSARDSR
jgi:hypothetical protein